MYISNDPNTWAVYGLVLVLGILLGLFMTAGGRKKWKTRYYDEVDRRKVLESEHAAAEREWRERDSLRDAAERDRARAAAKAAPVAGATTVAATGDPRDVNNDGLVTPAERKPGIMDRMLGRDRDGDGVPDNSDVAPDDSSKA